MRFCIWVAMEQKGRPFCSMATHMKMRIFIWVAMEQKREPFCPMAALMKMRISIWVAMQQYLDLIQHIIDHGQAKN